MTRIDILDVKIDRVSHQEAMDKIAILMTKNHSIITTTNTEFVIEAQKNKEFRDILNNTSKLNLADGVGILWAAKFNALKLPKNPLLAQIYICFAWIGLIIIIPFAKKTISSILPEKISGADFIWPLARFAAENKYRLFLLGGAPTIAERTALKLQTDIYDLRIGGVYSGQASEVEEILSAINKSKADILLVAFGAPKQEIWLSKYLKKTCCKLAIGVGGTFDFIAGAKSRAPHWMQRSGLEWLFRLYKEPSRIKRQLSIPKFMWRVLIHRLKTVSKSS